MNICPCGSELSYEECCRPLIVGARPAATAEALMRARYSAFVKTEIDYILNTICRKSREEQDAEAVRAWAEKSEWQGLEILQTEKGGAEDQEGVVEFVANFVEGGVAKKHHEIATFIREEGNWVFENGYAPKVEQYVRATPKVGRNEPCSCGSGKKYKKCCGK